MGTGKRGGKHKMQLILERVQNRGGQPYPGRGRGGGPKKKLELSFSRDPVVVLKASRRNGPEPKAPGGIFQIHALLLPGLEASRKKKKSRDIKVPETQFGNFSENRATSWCRTHRKCTHPCVDWSSHLIKKKHPII